MGTILKALPNKITAKLPALVDEQKEIKDDKLLAAFNAQANAKVSTKKQ